MNNNYLFFNGEVITVDNNNAIKQAVFVKDNKIIATGTNEEVLALKDDQTELIDLEGKTLMPGFIDSHIHITMYGTNQLSVSCKSESVQTIDDLLTELKNSALHTEKGKWVRAWGFNDTTIADKRFPTLEELDNVSSDHPIMVIRACGHISAVNSYALRLAGIDKHTPNPEGGKIDKHANGELTGLLLENAHMNMFSIAAFSDEEIEKAHEIASNHFAEKGITSIHDATGYGLNNLRLLQQSTLSGTIKQRVYAMVGSLSDAHEIVKHINESGISTGLGNEKYRLGPVKLFLDGSSSGPTVWTREPYTSDPNNYGIHYYTQEEVDDLFIPAHKNGWQFTAHAQGDAAIDMLLNTIEKANELYPRKNTRHRIEHAGIATPDLVKRMKEQNVVPTPNPAFLHEYGDGYVKNYGERAYQMFPLNDYLKEGVPAAISSDCPVTDFTPIQGIHSAITRKSPSGEIIGGTQRVSLLDAIRMYTINGAYASFEENIKGSIEPGKLADLILFDRSLLNCETDELLDSAIEWTMIDGEFVYSKKNEVAYK
ncbi:amidohydrolase [Sutcliffiella cohnii]|uniref:Amidohydrolase n=1 Tax=Sutcliffiella cohnii TaxID=33932 RepID=A0A223KMU7_9BACI|nr:amidohydrolase [Sutcliffiella cohnii]AST90802.1 amidohydrolase [Sutcliffiella cohnii]